MENWKETYPYLLDQPLMDAIKVALKNDDKEMAKKLWDLFTSYRKSSEHVSCYDVFVK